MTAKTSHDRIIERLQTIEWQIADARKALQQAAETMMRRAIEAKSNCDALMRDEVCSLVWTEFAEGDLRTAKEARARFESLIEMQRMLKHLAVG